MNVLLQDGRVMVSFHLTTRRRGLTFSLQRGAPSHAERGLLPDACSFVDAQRVFVKADQFGSSYLLDLRSQSVAPVRVPAGNSVMSPNGAWIARWDQTLDGAISDVELWRLGASPARVRVLPGSAGALRAAFSPDGAQLITADGSGRLVHWDTATGSRTLWRDRTERRSLHVPDDASDALDAPVSAELDEDLAGAPREVRPDPVTRFLFSPDGGHVLVAYQAGNLQLFDARSGKPVEAFRGHEPWTNESLWEATLLARRLGLRLDPTWPKVPEFVDPLKHLAALEDRVPEGIIQSASRARLRLLRNAIIARRGGTFESPLLRSLLSGNVYPPSPGYTPDRLTAVDRENIMRIKRRERELGGPIGDTALQAALASGGIERPFERGEPTASPKRRTRRCR